MVLKKVMCIGRNTENYKFELDNLPLENGKEEVVLVVTIDEKTNIDSHIKNISKKAVLKLSVFLRITNYPAGNYMFELNNTNTRTRCEIGVVLLSLLSTLNIFLTLF